jgi:glycosyltransferase involved in cell wall biosynthesis/SAM-dependent methyltransferase
MSDAPPTGTDVAARERAKWDDYYANLGEAEESPPIRAFGAEFASLLAELLPAGVAVLEAGCGAGFQSLALAREGRLAVSLMDISPQALDAARRLFARSGLTADAHLGDVFAPGSPQYDLVFNAGVLEHYTLGQQAEFLRGMASRTRRYVLVLVPNRLCYWYWVWRVQQAGRGNWPYGKECPQADLSAAFRAAGLTYIGQAFVGAEWTEDLIGNVHGLATDLRGEVLAVHRTGVIDAPQRCYLTAALGCVGDPPPALPPRWASGDGGGDMRLAELTSSLADALALRLGMEAELRTARREHQAEANGLRASLAQAEVDSTALKTFRTSRAYGLAEKLLKWKARLAPPGSIRAAVGRRTLQLVRAIARPFRRRPSATTPPTGFALVRERVAASGRRPVVLLPSVPWNMVLFQRPQHLAREIARLGHVVVYDLTGVVEADPAGVKEIEPNVFLYHGHERHLAALPDPVVWAFSYNYHQADAYPASATKVYDWIDDLAVFPHDQQMLQRNHERAVKEASVVASVARRLHEQLLPARPDAVYLPNAAEAERFANPAVRPADDPDLRSLLGRSKAVAGYYGALAAWFDYPLLKAVARRLPDWGFVLIGPDYDGSIRTAGLDGCPNVKWLGPRDYTTLPGYLRLFDVATIPFVINDITLATSPLKLFEYFAGGVPVVTTRMPECVAFPEVRIADTADQFATALEAARADGRSTEVRDRLRELGRANTWAARAQQIMAVVAGLPAG